MRFSLKSSATLNRAAPIAIRAIGGVLLLTLAFAINAQGIFRWVDKNGKVHYSDMMPPPAEVKSVETTKLTDSVIEQADFPFAVATAMKNNPVTLYTSNCGQVCVDAKAFLAKRGIPFTERNPETDVAAAKVLKEKAGALQVPTISIGATVLSGYSEEGWITALNAAGYPSENPLQRQGAAKAGPKVAAPTAPVTTAK